MALREASETYCPTGECVWDMIGGKRIEWCGPCAEHMAQPVSVADIKQAMSADPTAPRTTAEEREGFAEHMATEGPLDLDSYESRFIERLLRDATDNETRERELVAALLRHGDHETVCNWTDHIHLHRGVECDDYHPCDCGWVEMKRALLAGQPVAQDELARLRVDNEDEEEMKRYVLGCTGRRRDGEKCQRFIVGLMARYDETGGFEHPKLGYCDLRNSEWRCWQHPGGRWPALSSNEVKEDE